MAGCGGGGGNSAGVSAGSIDGFVLYKEGTSTIVPVTSAQQGYRALAGATVTVGTVSKITDNEGYYQLDGLPAGYQTVEISKDGYTSARFIARVVANQVTRVPAANRARWTILVFINADNNLEPAAIANINQMERVGSSEDINIVVQVDRSPGYDTSDGNWTGTRRYLVTRDQTSAIQSTLLQDMGELDMGSPGTLKNFVQWGMASYPSDRTMLVMWDHGRGWRTARAPREPVKSISYDDTSGTNLSVGELASALNAGQKLDVIAFDACLMGMIEIAYALRDRANWMVASEENVPFNGQPYDRFLSALAGNPDMTAPQLGQAMAQAYIGYYGPGSLTTESVIDLSKMSGLTSQIKLLAQDLAANRNSYSDALESIRAATQRYDNDVDIYADYKDLYDYARRISLSALPTSTKAAARQVMDSVSGAVSYQENSGGAVANSHGISIYLPAWYNYLIEYGNLQFTVDTRWDTAIKP